MRVIIAGGGIGGLATAIAVRKLGLEPVVLERKDELGDVGAGLGLYPNAMKAMTWLGADALIRQKSIDNQRVESRILETDELLVNRNSAATARMYGEHAYTVHRADLHMALAREVPPDSVRLDARVVDVTHTPNGVAAHLQNGDSIEGDVLVGADGLRSNVRTCLFGEQEAQFTGIVTWRCLIPADRISDRYQSIQIVWFGDNRHAMIYGVRDNTYCLNAFVPADEVHAESWGVMGDVSKLPGLYPGACAALEDILHAVDSALITPIYFRNPLDEWSKGRATLLGDAAHPAPPSAGQGAAMALEDALVLAHALKRHGRDAIPAALADYADRRKARTRMMLLASRVQLRVHNQPDPVQREARNTWLRGTEQIEPGIATQSQLWALDPVAHATGPVSSVAPLQPKSASSPRGRAARFFPARRRDHARRTYATMGRRARRL
ncbi:MAG: FAD-dependent monooxygenase [Alphaproteobacteria bacterium]